jgi:hypothetical protein
MAEAQPRIHIREATPDDVDSLVDIHFDAFGGGIMSRLLNPNGPTQEARAKFASMFFPEAIENPTGVEPFTMVAELLPKDATDTDSPEIVAFGRWLLCRQPRPESEWNVETVMTAEQLGEGVDVDFHNSFIGGLRRKNALLAKGDPCLRKSYLAFLACPYRPVLSLPLDKDWEFSSLVPPVNVLVRVHSSCNGGQSLPTKKVS